MPDEIHRADLAARRRAMILICMAALAGGLLILLVDQHRSALIDWLGTDPQSFTTRIRVLIVALALAFSLPVSGFALWLWRLGTKVRDAGRFPLPGQKLLRDTRVLTGENAMAHSRLCRAAAVLLAGMALLFPLLLWFLVHALLRSVVP